LIQDDFALRLIGKWIGNSDSTGRMVLRSRRGIPQGAVISPFLCNLYLTAIDRDLACHGIPFVRYADNIFIMAKSRNEAISSKTFLTNKLQALHLNLNPGKTTVFHIGRGFSFLGRDVFNPVSFLKEDCRIPDSISIYDFGYQFNRMRQIPRAVF